MNDAKYEAISALMDGENPDAAGQTINELLRDEAARHAWGRYHLISDCLRQALPARIDPSLPVRISTMLRGEPTVFAPRRALRSAILKPLAGFAIAASVAAMALIGFQLNRGSNGNSGMEAQPEVASQAPLIQAPGSFTFASGHPGAQPARAQLAGGQGSARLNRYLVNYNEYRSNAAMQGMFPYVRIVAHGNNE